MARRVYTSDQRANALAALAANGGNVSATARALGIPRKSLEQWSTGARAPEARADAVGKMAELADVMEEVAWQLLRSLPGKIEGASLIQLTTSMGIVIDKMLLLRGQVPHEPVSDEDRVARLAILLDAARGRQEASSNPSGSTAPPSPSATSSSFSPREATS